MPQLCETMNGEQNLNEKWLFISFNNKGGKKQQRGTQLNYQAKGLEGTEASVFSYAPN